MATEFTKRYRIINITKRALHAYNVNIALKAKANGKSQEILGGKHET